MIKVFVYGNLKKDKPIYDMWDLDEHIHSIEDARIRGELFLSVWGYPCAVPNEKGIVKGELHTYKNDAILRVLDRIENYYGKEDWDNLYNRIEVEVEVQDRKEKAWMYVPNFPVDRSMKIEKGEW